MGTDITILLVDDSGTMRKIEKMSLGKLGYKNIIEAENGKVGLQKLEENKVDLIISDWNMPEMNGLQFVNAVRADERFKDIPIIMLTTVNTEQEIITIMQAGANAFINKPFTPEKLKEKIDEILG